MSAPPRKLVSKVGTAIGRDVGSNASTATTNTTVGDKKEAKEGLTNTQQASCSNVNGNVGILAWPLPKNKPC